MRLNLLPNVIHAPGRLLVGVATCAMMVSTACSSDARAEARAATGGDPERGRMLIRTHGCIACHSIPGVSGAHGIVGPPLAGMASRGYIRGVLSNTPDHMVRWLLDPRSVDSLTAMPNVGLTEAEARHVAAYLYTLR